MILLFNILMKKIDTLDLNSELSAGSNLQTVSNTVVSQENSFRNYVSNPKNEEILEISWILFIYLKNKIKYWKTILI